MHNLTLYAITKYIFMENENIKVFVRKTLGCECPEKVFEYIESQHNIKLINDILLNNKINIGNTLLIYILEVNDFNFIRSNLSTLLRIGKNERDRRGFNRFRLVLVTDKINEIKQGADRAFKTLTDKDEKIHLHIVNRNEYQGYMDE